MKLLDRHQLEPGLTFPSCRLAEGHPEEKHRDDDRRHGQRRHEPDKEPPRPKVEPPGLCPIHELPLGVLARQEPARRDRDREATGWEHPVRHELVDHDEPARLAAEEPLAERASEVELGDRDATPKRQRGEDREGEHRAATQQRRLGPRDVVFVDHVCGDHFQQRHRRGERREGH